MVTQTLPLQSVKQESRTLSMPNVLLRAEGLALFVAAVAAYALLHYNGWIFALLLLAPDLAMLGYLRSTRVGAWAYNIAHFYGLPLALGAVGLLTGQDTLLMLALIWWAHISMDRVVGYGFKYATAFKDTHLDRV